MPPHAHTGDRQRASAPSRGQDRTCQGPHQLQKPHTLCRVRRLRGSNSSLAPSLPLRLAPSHPRILVWATPPPPLRIPAPCSVVGRMHGLKGMTGVPTTSWRVTAAWLDPKNWNRRHTHAHPPTYPPILHACILDVDIQPLHPCTTSICTSSCTLCMHILMHPPSQARSAQAYRMGRIQVCMCRGSFSCRLFRVRMHAHTYICGEANAVSSQRSIHRKSSVLRHSMLRHSMLHPISACFVIQNASSLSMLRHSGPVFTKAFAPGSIDLMGSNTWEGVAS